jgi:hypothetical protein
MLGLAFSFPPGFLNAIRLFYRIKDDRVGKSEIKKFLVMAQYFDKPWLPWSI